MIEALKTWFKSEKRDLPWRHLPTPYRVWISEVMLQQTQVSVVIAYFQRWMERFPTIASLAEAPLEEVIKLWEGLGYYARARQIHSAAQQMVRDYQGELPATAEELRKLKGLGPYTVGAILSFAFHQKAAAVDGNVLRVMARLLSLEKDICKAETKKEIESAVFALLPKKEPWVVMEALIELGATICQKQPKCSICPLQSTCCAFQEGKERELPIKTKRVPTTFLTRYVGVILAGSQVLVKQERGKKVMAGLYEFPYFESEKELAQMGMALKLMERFSMVTHSFTRYRATLYPSVWEAKKALPIEDHVWVDLDKLDRLPFSSGHRRILKELKALKESQFANLTH